MDFNIILRTIAESLSTFLTESVNTKVKVVSNYNITKDEKFKAYKDVTLTLYYVINRKKNTLFNVEIKERIVTESEEVKALQKALFILLCKINVYIDNKGYTRLLNG